MSGPPTEDELRAIVARNVDPLYSLPGEPTATERLRAAIAKAA